MNGDGWLWAAGSLGLIGLAAGARAFRRRLASMKTGVVLLAAVAVLAALGVIVGQGLPDEAYAARYGPALGAFLVRSGMASIYTSWYFLLAVTALAISIVTCSVARAARLARTPAGPRVPRMGSLLTHLSIIVIAAGGVVTALSGFRVPAPRYLAAGDEVEVPGGGYSLRVERAATEFDEDGALSEYVSVVTVLENGRDAGTHRIEVNHPLVHRGIGVYQYEMLPAPDSVTDVVLGVIAGSSGGTEVVVPFGGEEAVPGTRLSLKALAFLSDFTYDIERGTAELASARHDNPAVLVQVSDAGLVVGERWVFAGFAGHADDRDLPCRLFLLDYRPDYERGLTRFEFSRQPGTPLVYGGFGALSLGLCLSFWARVPRRET